MAKDPAREVTDADLILFDNRPVAFSATRTPAHIMFHKPFGTISSMAQSGGSDITAFIDFPERLFPAGRLDRDSSGLLLLSNNGELTHKLTHPSSGIQKEYIVKNQRPLTRQDYERIMRGVAIDGRTVVVDQLTPGSGGRLRITIHEGRNRILRRLFGHIGHNVIELKRVRIGPLHIGRLGVGKWRKLTGQEVDMLLSAVGIK